jgi:thioredoxin 1
MMNRIVRIVLLTILLISPCFYSFSQGSSTKSASSGIVIEHLSTLAFKQKVFNFEVNKDWKYLGDKPCIVDFYASWCGPCRMLSPTLEKMAKKYKGQINVYKVDTDAETELSSAFGISSIPSLLFCPVKGQPQMFKGLMSEVDLERLIKENLIK